MRRRALLSAVLLAELAIGAVLVAASPSPPAQWPAQTRELSDGRTVRLVNEGGQRGEALLKRVSTDIPVAIDAVVRFWGPDVERDIVVVATGSEEDFVRRAHLDPQRRWSDIAAVAVADSVDLTAQRAAGQRIVLAPEAARMSDSALRIVLTHELFHLAARPYTALDAPRWFTEGVADFVARPPEPLPRGASAGTALPADAELDVAGPARAAGYDRAWWFARFVAADFGVDGLRRLYTEAAGAGRTDFATAVRAALGTDIDGLQARWERWLRAPTG
ncbi:MAG: hypothetical protein NTY24_02490 [Mycobacterium sp.]|jgi:hypothetical protein|nr:hypothetical protein [Mycobacterium sp.]